MGKSEGLIKAMIDLGEAANKLGRNDISKALQQAGSKLARQEWHLVALGETSSGKSCLINTLIDQSLLPEMPGAATAQILFVDTCPPEGAGRYEGILSNGGTVPLGRQDFMKACTDSMGEWGALRANVPVVTPLPPGVVVVDTPGYNSCLERHTRVLTEYLPHSDAIIFIINYRRGFTPEDRDFLKLAQECVGEGGRIFFAVNFSPGALPDARTNSISRKLAQLYGQQVYLHIIVSRGPGQTRLEASTLWKDIGNRLSEADIQREAQCAAVSLAFGFTSILAEELSVHEAAVAAPEAGLGRLRERIQELRATRQESLHIISRYECIFKDKAISMIDEGIEAIGEKAGAEIDGAGATDFISCAEYVRTQIMPIGVDLLRHDIDLAMQKIGNEMAEKLEDIALKAERLDTPDFVIASPGPGGFLENLRDQAVKGGAQALARAYLGKIGGAVGERAGIVNLAKMAFSRGGRLIGKRFSRQFYYNMGQMLKRFGITSGRAVGTFAAAVMEAVALIYTVSTWKRSLKVVVAQTLGLARPSEPILDQIKNGIFSKEQVPLRKCMETGYLEAITECMSGTRELVEEDFDRRISVLSSSLEKRQKSGEKCMSGLLEIKSELERIAVALLHLKAVYEEGPNG